MVRNILKHAAVAVFFALMACVWSAPLVAHLSTHIPGSGIGDNAIFFWNDWWMRMALSTGANYFQTSYIFAPVGVDLTLHVHTALPSLVSATLLGKLPILTALNITTVGSLALNGFCAYLLAYRLVGDRSAAIVAGLMFGSSPYLAIHLAGHFDLTAAWTIPLFAMLAYEARHGEWRASLGAGVVLGVTMYVAYYYVVYELALGLLILLLASRDWRITLRPPTAARARMARAIAVTAVVMAIVVVVIIATGGLDLRLGPVRLHMHDTFNPRQILGVLLFGWTWVRFMPRLHGERSPEWRLTRVVASLALAGLAVVIVAAPVLWATVKLVSHGDYVTQRYLWRSAPKGVDLATLILGHPSHGLIGGWAQQLYARFDIDRIESCAWFGVVPVVLAIWAIRRRWSDRLVRQWTTIGACFFVWALGPHLMVFGHNTGVILPQTVLRYLPILSNARIPSRAIICVYLALAILGAVTLAEWRKRWPRPELATLGVAGLLFVELLPAPFALAQVDHPAIYDVLRDRPEQGAVCELPMGFNDSFGETGALDRHTMIYQSIHRRPMTGGLVGRLPDSVRAFYLQDPVLSALLRLSARNPPSAIEPAGLPDRDVAASALEHDGIRFVMLNRATASAALANYVEHTLPLTLIMRDEDRALYLVIGRMTPGR